MWKVKNVLKAFICTIVEVIFVVMCVKIFELNKVEELIVLFEILIIFTVIVCAMAIINILKDNRT